jgi:hypothetical protein
MAKAQQQKPRGGTVARAKPKEKKSRIVGPSRRVVLSKEAKLKEMLARLELPTEPKEPETDIGFYSLLLYADAGLGKTETFAGFPDTMFLTTEPGTQGISIFEFNSKNGGCTCWEIALAAKDKLLAKPGSFKSVIVDTADEFYSQCSDFVCKQEGIKSPGLKKDGKSDRSGSGWRLVRREFTSYVQTLKRAGYAVHFTSHAKLIDVEDRAGNTYNRVVPTMTGQAYSVIGPIVDFIWYIDYMRSSERSDVNRVIFTQGDDFIIGKSRSVGEQSFYPRMIPALGVNTYKLLEAGARGEDIGLDPSTLVPTNRTFKAIHDHMSEGRKQAQRQQDRGTVRRVRGG